MRIVDIGGRTKKKDSGGRNEMSPKTPRHLMHRGHHKQNNVVKSDATHESLRRPNGYCEGEIAQVGWTCNKIEWPVQKTFFNVLCGGKGREDGRKSGGQSTYKFPILHSTSCR